MLGYAWQKGCVPLSLEAIERAIELNGVAVETSKRTFAWGRLRRPQPRAPCRPRAKPTLAASRSRGAHARRRSSPSGSSC